jgi:predicted dehydrogenase
LTRQAQLEIAVIGAGAMGSLHCRIVSQHPWTSLACLVDPDRAVGERVARQFGTRWVADLDSFALVDAVIVASPTEVHEQWVARVLEAGTPVLVEKPMALDVRHVEQMVAESERRDVPITCGFVERWNPAVLLALEVIEHPVHFQAVRHSPYAPRIKTGVAGDLLIHDVDLALRIAGSDPVAVTASTTVVDPRSLPGAEDLAEAHLRFDRNADRPDMIATASASRIAQRKIRSISVTEIDRTIELDLLRQDVTIYKHVDNALLEDSGGYRQQTVIDIPVIPVRKEPLARQLDHFVELVNGKVDAAEERRSLVPPHRVIAGLRT